ncbi:transposase [Fulvivirga kasyanovii]|nr:transposase [Fulvivirga kasyanovii]
MELLSRIGLELGGNKGAIISGLAGVPVSCSTLLRVVKNLPITAEGETSGVIGVDDWAFKKAKTYGTIIVDLNRRKVIDLLPDREAATLCGWLSAHPEVKVVSRDRASAYSLGVNKGAPKLFRWRTGTIFW